MKRKQYKITTLFLIALMILGLCGCSEKKEDDLVVLRVSNWEEYIDLGEWDEDELIELESGTNIFGYQDMISDFEEWYYDKYGIRVKVEYSTFGTCEELYNHLTIGDVYDIASPSEYMIMKMMREGMLTPYSEDFFDTEKEDNYYSRGVSPYIDSVFDSLSIEGLPFHDYAAGYMWGTLGLVYNPEFVTEEEAAHWNLLTNRKFNRQVTIKDSVRDAYFAAISLNCYDEITAESFVNADNYHDLLSDALNRTDEVTVSEVEKVLTECKDNVYAFETDAGKADMVTGKVVANEQWSGDAVYTMDQADEDGIELCYSAPSEGTNLWFDGWVLIKKGMEEDSRKQHAAEAFVNFVSMPENAIRNMYYIGYTSVISGGDSNLIFEYMDWTYGAEEDEEDTVEYNNIGYFFGDDSEEGNEEYSIVTTEDQQRRQLYAQYPPKDVVDRAVVMQCFEDEDNTRINRMWINVRCFDLNSIFG